MITAPEAANEIKRLSGLDFFPKDPPALLELRKAAEFADSQAVLSGVVTDWIAEQREAPKPSDLRRLIHDRNAPRSIASPDCPTCRGTGFEIVQRGGYSGARECACRMAAKCG